MATYIKHMSEREFLITLTAAKAGIAPKIKSYQRLFSPLRYEVSLERYPLTLIDIEEIADRRTYCPQILTLVERLHCLGIAHLDINEENIVVDPIKHQARLIDFGMSRWVEEITPDFLRIYIYPVKNRQELLLSELKDAHFACAGWCPF